MKNTDLKGYIFLAGYRTLREFARDVQVANSTLTNAICNPEKFASLSLKIRIVSKINEKLKNNPLVKHPITLYDVFPDAEQIDVSVLLPQKEDKD